jgi:hypothetical protein
MAVAEKEGEESMTKHEIALRVAESVTLLQWLILSSVIAALLALVSRSGGGE